MKKYIGIIAGLAVALSLGLAGAQSGGVNVSGICLEKNSAGVCIRYGNVSVGTTQTGGTGVYQNGAYQTGSSAYTQGVNTSRQTNQIDLGFFGSLINQVGSLIRLLPPILLGVAVVVFFWFLIKYLIAEKVPEEKQKALKNMMYSLGAIFVMVALWGIIAFFGDALGINPNVQVSAPTLPR